MRCPTCGKRQSYVIDSRVRIDTIYRRRECVTCDSRFSTYEIPKSLLIDALDKFVEKKVLKPWTGSSGNPDMQTKEGRMKLRLARNVKGG